VPE
jgi:hypothetical protein